ncbi:hypothetical protein ACLQ8T_07250 [Glutamicibacter sp. FR1]|uniref:hypothetical protein n=1 Tax=Glutamicibacter sp. FR1 TaxID=3393744 RepID=UPI0039AE9E99
MRVVLFDGIQEMHVVRSLGRAFLNRGHNVCLTGKLTSGFEYITDGQDLDLVQAAIEETLAFKPDIIIVFRPSALPINLLPKLRSSGARLFVWLSDDPVLWNQTYKYSINEYDAILHCGGKNVLDFYESKFGYATGVNFPFWTDTVEFPYSYGRNEPESELVFLGNATGPIRRQRYYDLATLSSSLKIYGNVNPDYFGLGGGYLDSQEEIRQVGSTAKIAINIPQYFQTYENQPMWFDELGGLGYFETPSRVVQCAAMGLPIVTIEPKNISPSAFQSSLRVADIRACEELTRRLLEKGSLNEISNRIFEEFAKYYHADSRVMAIESLMENDSWKNMDSTSRATWYRQFESNTQKLSKDRTEFDGSFQRPDDQRLFVSEPFGKVVNRRDVDIHATLGSNVLLIGDRWKFAFSPSNVIYRQLTSSGLTVKKFDIFRNGKKYSSEDPTELFARLIDIVGFEESENIKFDSIVLVGDNYSIDKISRMKLKDRGAVLVSYSLLGPDVTMRTKVLSSLSDVLTTPDQKMVSACKHAGIRNMIYIPDMVDESFIAAASNIESNGHAITLLLQREGHKTLHQDILGQLSLAGAEVLIADDFESVDDLGEVAKRLATDLLIVFPDPSRPGNLNSKFLGHGLLMANQVALYRVPTASYTELEGANSFLFGSLNELFSKYNRSYQSVRKNDLATHCQVTSKYSGANLISSIISFIEDSESKQPITY